MNSSGLISSVVIVSACCAVSLSELASTTTTSIGTTNCQAGHRMSIVICVTEQTRTVNAGRPSVQLRWIWRFQGQRSSVQSKTWNGAGILRQRGGIAKTAETVRFCLCWRIFQNAAQPRDNYAHSVTYGWVHHAPTRWTIQYNKRI